MLAKPVTIACRDTGASWAGNTHRIIIQRETETDWYGWPDPTDPRNSNVWKPGVDEPMRYPKFAWRIVP